VYADTRRRPLALLLASRTARLKPALFAVALLLLCLAGTAGPAAAQIPGALNATLTASPNPAVAGQPVSFSYSARPPAVAPPFPSITSVTVSYGDGGSDFGNTGASGQPVMGLLSHVYATPGTYSAMLTATSSNGEAGSATVTVTVLPGSPASAAASGSWLDSPLNNWNSPGMAIPAAPPVNQSGNDSFCASQFRPAENANDRAITAAGWRLFGSYQGGWGLYIAGGQADEDGMCRPLSYQDFVFVNGAFAGTISPVLMNSRTDGAVEQISIGDGGSTITANFARYAPTDALCCPSSTTTATYHIAMVSGSAVLVPDSASTMPNS
jgi:PKD repeat protein